MCSSAGPMSLQKASRRTIAVQKFASIIRDRRSWEKVTSGWSRRRSISSPSTAIWTPVTTTSTSGRLASVAYWRAAFSGYHTSSSSQNETSGASVAATPALRPPGRPGVWSFASTRTGRLPPCTSMVGSGSERSKTTTVSIEPGKVCAAIAAIARRRSSGRSRVQITTAMSEVMARIVRYAGGFLLPTIGEIVPSWSKTGHCSVILAPRNGCRWTGPWRTYRSSNRAKSGVGSLPAPNEWRLDEVRTTADVQAVIPPDRTMPGGRDDRGDRVGHRRDRRRAECRARGRGDRRARRAHLPDRRAVLLVDQAGLPGERRRGLLVVDAEADRPAAVLLRHDDRRRRLGARRPRPPGLELPLL